MTYWIIHISLLGGLSYLSFRFLKGDFPVFLFWSGLALKLIAGIVLGFIFYDYYGGGDTISFFEFAKNGTQVKNERTGFFVTLIRPLVQSTGDSYWITSLWLSFISFLGSWYAVLMLSRLYPSIKNVIAACFLLIPTVIFWSSGVMKDAVAFAAMMPLIALVVKFYLGSRLSILDVILLLIGAFLLLQIKHYLLITILIFGGILTCFSVLKRTNGMWKWPIAIIILIAALYATQFIHPYLKIDRIAWALFENNQAIIQKSDSSDINLVLADYSWLTILKKIPNALHAGLFRPSILDETPIWGWVHKIENLTLTILLFLTLLLSIKHKPKVDRPLLGASILCILLLVTMLPLSTPNFGTLVRYKNAFMPFLFLLCSILPYRHFTSHSLE